MYRIEKTKYGCLVRLSGFIQKEEFLDCVESIRQVIQPADAQFSVLFDIRGLEPLPLEVIFEVRRGQTQLLELGLLRSAVVYSNTLPFRQARRTAEESGVCARERYFNAAKEPDWRNQAIEWIEKGSE